MEEFIIENYDKYSIVELYKLLCSKFDVNFNERGLRTKCYKLGLKKNKVHKYSNEEYEYLKANAHLGMYKLAEQFNSKFNTNLSANALMQQCHKHNIAVGSNKGQFQVGGNPWDKSISKEYYLTRLHQGTLLGKGQFRKGITPANSRDIGYERDRTNKGVFIKTQDGWKLKQVVVWEKYKYPVPNNYVVIFADANKDNFDINNLRCIPNRTFIRLHRNGWLDCGVPELLDAEIQLCELMNKIYDKR